MRLMSVTAFDNYEKSKLLALVVGYWKEFSMFSKIRDIPPPRQRKEASHFLFKVLILHERGAKSQQHKLEVEWGRLSITCVLGESRDTKERFLYFLFETKSQKAFLHFICTIFSLRLVIFQLRYIHTIGWRRRISSTLWLTPFRNAITQTSSSFSCHETFSLSRWAALWLGCFSLARCPLCNAGLFRCRYRKRREGIHSVLGRVSPRPDRQWKRGC